jgi:hypothetical protein
MGPIVAIPVEAQCRVEQAHKFRRLGLARIERELLDTAGMLVRAANADASYARTIRGWLKRTGRR